MKITDEDLLSGKRVTVAEAAAYIGTTTAMLTWLMQQDAINGTKEVPFGFAKKKSSGGQWRYNIISSQLFQYKKGRRLERDEEIAQAKEIIREKDRQIIKLEALIHTMAQAIAEATQESALCGTR